MFFSAMDNLISPSKGRDMGDGWETKRNRTPNNEDWVILRLGHQGIVKKIIVDTNHFKGNYPDSCAIDACNCANDNEIMNTDWQPLLEQKKMEAHQEHAFDNNAIERHEPITHIKLKIYPDGGISRLRIFGNIKH